MKEMLYAALESMPNPAEQSINSQAPLEAGTEQYFIEYVEEFDQTFLHFADKELQKINTFFAEKLAESTRKFADLKNELNSVLPGVDRDSEFRMQIIARDGGSPNHGAAAHRGGPTHGTKKELAATTRKAAKKISERRKIMGKTKKLQKHR